MTIAASATTPFIQLRATPHLEIAPKLDGFRRSPRHPRPTQYPPKPAIQRNRATCIRLDVTGSAAWLRPHAQGTRKICARTDPQAQLEEVRQSALLMLQHDRLAAVAAVTPAEGGPLVAGELFQRLPEAGQSFGGGVFLTGADFHTQAYYRRRRATMPPNARASRIVVVGSGIKCKLLICAEEFEILEVLMVANVTKLLVVALPNARSSPTKVPRVSGSPVVPKYTSNVFVALFTYIQMSYHVPVVSPVASVAVVAPFWAVRLKIDAHCQRVYRLMQEAQQVDPKN